MPAIWHVALRQAVGARPVHLAIAGPRDRRDQRGAIGLYARPPTEMPRALTLILRNRWRSADRRHPLYRRRFRILSVVQGQRSAGFVSVEYRLDISLILPISATSLQAVVTHKVPTKLSLEALGDLLAVAGEREGGCRSS